MKLFALALVLAATAVHASPGGFLTDVEKNCSLSLSQYEAPGSKEKIVKYYGLCKWSHSIEQTEFLCATKDGKVPSQKDCMEKPLKQTYSINGDTAKFVELHKQMEASKAHKDCTAGVNDSEGAKELDGNPSDGTKRVLQYPLGAGKK